MALPEKNRIKRKSDFDDVYKKGRSRSGDFLFIKVKNNDYKNVRFGFVIPQKIISSAVARNKIKRLLTESVRRELDLIGSGVDVIVYLKKRPSDGEILREEIKALIGSIIK